MLLLHIIDVQTRALNSSDDDILRKRARFYSSRQPICDHQCCKVAMSSLVASNLALWANNSIQTERDNVVVLNLAKELRSSWYLYRVLFLN